MPTRWRVRAAAVAALLLVSLLLPAGGQRHPAEAAVVPGTSAWLETLDRGDTFRLVVSKHDGDHVLAPQVYGRPAVSPDGTRIAYSAPVTDGSDGRYALYVVGVDGRDRRKLTNPKVGDFDPAWSPDGRLLVVSRDERGNFEASCCTLWLVSADGPSTRRLGNATSARQPAFSPDGRSVAYTGPAGIQVAGTNGAGNRRLVTGSYSWPTWSPDGARIAAVRRTSLGRGTIALVPSGGGTPVDTSAGSPGGLPEAPVFTSARTILHLNAWGEGENGRTRADLYRTEVGGSTSRVYSKSRPLYYFSWSDGRPCTEPSSSPPPSPGTDSPAVVRFGGWHLRAGLESGPADACFNYGLPSDTPVTGDWDGDGTRTPGIVRGSVWHLRNSNTPGSANLSVTFGRPGDVPVVGDWDGDGTDTIGIVRENTFHLSNSNTSGGADLSYAFGWGSDRKVVGDWDGDGTDTIGIVRGNTWHITNRHSPTAADLSTGLGRSTDVPVVGDWDGNATQTMGVFRGGSWYLSNDNTSGTPHINLTFGRARDVPVIWR